MPKTQQKMRARKSGEKTDSESEKNTAQKTLLRISERRKKKKKKKKKKRKRRRSMKGKSNVHGLPKFTPSTSQRDS